MRTLAETALTVAKLCNVASALNFGPGGSYEAGIAAAKPVDRFAQVTLDGGTVSAIVATLHDLIGRPVALAGGGRPATVVAPPAARPRSKKSSASPQVESGTTHEQRCIN